MLKPLEIELIQELEVIRVQDKINENVFKFGVMFNLFGELSKPFYYLITSKQRGIDEEMWENNISNAFVANFGAEEKIVCFEYYGISVFSFVNLKKERSVNLRDNDYNQYFKIESELKRGITDSFRDYINKTLLVNK